MYVNVTHHAASSLNDLAENAICEQARLGVPRHRAAALIRLACPAIKRTALCCLTLGGVCALVIPVTRRAFGDASDAVTGDLEDVVVKGNLGSLTCRAAAAAGTCRQQQQQQQGLQS
jgi:hypothetical protein